MLNRVSMVTNVLGAFTNTYVGGTGLLSTNFYPNGQKAVFSYLSITNDERLAEIWNQNSTNGTISKFDYAYDPVGNITNWTEQADNNTPTVAVMQYDPVNQLLNSTTFSNTVAGAILEQYAYSYDLGGNRTSEQIGTIPQGGTSVAVSQSFYNDDNQVTNRVSNGGPLVFAGSVSKQATVTVAGKAVAFNHFTSNFVGSASVNGGTNVVPIVATDYNNVSTTNKYQVVVTNNGVTETLSYDLDGNLTNVVTATSTNSYQWDAANRLVSASSPTNQSLFSYDGVGRRIQIVEMTNGVAYLTNRFIWDGQVLVEQRDLTGANVTKRFFGEGEQISGTNYFFTRDHLGSVREMTDNAGIIHARYDYDPYGRQVLISGTMNADFGYAGMFFHWPSELNLTFYRAYNPDLGRWLSRDPLAEAAGLNLYSYVANNPINDLDLLGLQYDDIEREVSQHVTAAEQEAIIEEGANSVPDQWIIDWLAVHVYHANPYLVYPLQPDTSQGPVIWNPNLSPPLPTPSELAGSGKLVSQPLLPTILPPATPQQPSPYTETPSTFTLDPSLYHQPKTLGVWQCIDSTGDYVRTQANSPGPNWTLLRTIIQ